MSRINRDILGYLRRALFMGSAPPSPELIGLVQPVVDAFGVTRDSIFTFRSTQVVPAAGGGGTLIAPFGSEPLQRNWGYILHMTVVTDTNARTLRATLEVAMAAPGANVDFYNSGTVSSLRHICIGGLTAIGLEGRSLQAIRTILIPSNLQEDLSGNAQNIRLTFGTGATDDNMTADILGIRFPANDPIPWLT